METILKKLDDKFLARYGKTFALLNLNINKTLLQNNEFYEVPLVTLGDGGATIIVGSPEIFQLAPPAKVIIDYKKVLPTKVIYRISVPEDDGVKASEDQAYFNYIFDPIVAAAIAGYKKAFGDETEIRFGEAYCSIKRPGPVEDSVFNFHDSLTSDHSGFEFRLTGNWASSTVYEEEK